MKLYISLFAFLVLMPFEAKNAYKEKYGSSQILPGHAFYQNLNGHIDQISGEEEKEVHVVVTSSKKLKIEATKQIFAENPRFKNAAIYVYAIPGKSNIAEQPLGLDAAFVGAFNRIASTQSTKQYKNLLKKHPKLYFCSIENFFTIKDVAIPRDHAAVVVKDPQGKSFRYVSDGVTIARDIYNHALSQGMANDGTGANITIGEILRRLYGISASNWHKGVTEIKNKTGKLMKKGYSRLEQILSAFKHSRYF